MKTKPEKREERQICCFRLERSFIIYRHKEQVMLHDVIEEQRVD